MKRPLEPLKRRAAKLDIGDYKPRPTPIETTQVRYNGDGNGNRRAPSRPTLEAYDRRVCRG
jgi:hypothetical protein